MCGRYTLHSNLNLILQQFAVEVANLDYSPRYNIAPTQSAPVVRETSQVRELSMLRWGLIPRWAKEEKIGNRMINARAETVADKPAFRSAFRKRRCLVPADGFYEWKKQGGRKVPFLIRIDKSPFGMAGLWETWRRLDSSEAIESYTVITTVANEATSELHDRMPVIIDEPNYEEWLDEENTDVDSLRRLLAPFPSDRMAIQPVSTYVNNPQHDDPKCIAPNPTLF